MTIKVVCPLMGSFKTILKSIRPFFVDRLAQNVHFNTNPIGWFLLNQPKTHFEAQKTLLFFKNTLHED